MPDYERPGVYVEELAHVPPPIPGLPTDVALFVGAAITAGCVDLFPTLASLADFERVHGRPNAASSNMPAVLLHLAVRAFFANGGRTLRIAPVASGEASAIADALASSAALADVAIVAAPGVDPLAAAPALIAHVTAPGSRRFAIIDPPLGLDMASVQSWRATLDSPNAALYFPWIVAPDARGTALAQPPSGYVAGIYARVDVARGVFKAPANEIVTGASALTTSVSSARQQTLNAIGINCIVSFPGRGIRVWGARTLGSNGDTPYVSVRRLLAWLEASIGDGLQWVAFEPNGEPTWAKVRDTVSNFLRTQWRLGAFAGAKPEEAFVVRCDRSTMAQADLDAGNLVCMIGVAPVRPAEFLVFRVRITTAG